MGFQAKLVENTRIDSLIYADILWVFPTIHPDFVRNSRFLCFRLKPRIFGAFGGYGAYIYCPFSTSSLLDDDDWGEHHHHRHHGHEYYPAYSVERVYVPERVVEYVPVQQRYYAPPPPPPVRGGYYDQRSPQGLVGGLVGSAMGYEMGGGDPLAAGIGAAAGSWFGNGMNR